MRDKAYLTVTEAEDNCNDRSLKPETRARISQVRGDVKGVAMSRKQCDIAKTWNEKTTKEVGGKGEKKRKEGKKGKKKKKKKKKKRKKQQQ